MRVPGAASTPEGGPGAPHAWELMVGWPRRDYDQPAKRLPGLENLDCMRVGDMADAAPERWGGRELTALDDDADADDCLPGADSGPGLDISGSGPLSVGSISYFWRFREHGGELFLGTLDVFSLIHPRLRAGFEASDRPGPETAGPELVLRAEDAAGHVSRFRWRTRVAPASTGPVEEPPAPVLIERLLGRLRER